MSIPAAETVLSPWPHCPVAFYLVPENGGFHAAWPVRTADQSRGLPPLTCRSMRCETAEEAAACGKGTWLEFNAGRAA